MVSIPMTVHDQTARTAEGLQAHLGDGFLCQDMSVEIVRDLESGAPCPYRIVVATDHERLREIAYWRDILAKIADDIDATAAREDDVKRRRWFDTRSRRIRELLAEPVPPGWSVATSTLRRG